jgi:ribulose-5-phosphate 4-epimerase/fuculose-1-phosphate aldolase
MAQVATERSAIPVGSSEPRLEHRRMPTFASVEEERLHRKQRLAAGFRLFARFGYDEGVAGHITARDPGEPDTFWVNPFGVDFSQVRVGNLVRVDASGEVVEGDHPVNRAAFAIHSQVHQARPDVVAAAHSHSVHGKAFSALGRRLDPITQDACAFYDDHGLFDDYTGVVLDVGEGRRIAEALGPHKAVILRNHGLLTVGSTVDAAVWWFVAMDRSCHAQLLADAAGQPVLIDPEQAALTCSQVGSEVAGWFSFQPLFDRIVALEPDLLD